MEDRRDTPPLNCSLEAARPGGLWWLVSSQSDILGARGIGCLARATPCRQPLCRGVIPRAAGQPSQDHRSRTRAASASDRTLGAASLSFVQRLHRLPVADHPQCLGGLLPQLAVAVLERTDEQVQGPRIMERAGRLGGLFARFGVRSRLRHLDRSVTVPVPLAHRDDGVPEVLQEVRAPHADGLRTGKGFIWSDRSRRQSPITPPRLLDAARGHPRRASPRAPHPVTVTDGGRRRTSTRPR